ncbi:MAG TPA: tetratricopeptide repeat-containing serine protease family protein [Verrucomicrobiae bacterium]|nr:tetratricopeptide repeat-containing serine protease family protein [Verrucomicrobiae bacterium]
MKIQHLLTSFMILALFAQVQLYAQQGDTNLIENIQTQAGKGDAKAQFTLGIYYYENKDYVDALKWYKEAADQGNRLAQYNLGTMYANGIVVNTNFAEAFKWLRESAEQGLTEAQYSLGICYDLGKGTARDYKQAAKWFRKAAEQGHVNAEYHIGFLYFNGQGVKKDFGEAFKWFKTAADQNQRQAQCMLGVLYSQGQGVSQDNAEAVKWYRKAAEQGFFPAEDKLGVAYYLGDKGLPENFVEAYKWLALAAAQGDEEAAEVREQFHDEMTPEQIAEAQREAASFVPHEEMPDTNSISTPPVLADNPTFTGTGFFITANGYLISNLHVVKDAARVRLLTGAGIVDAQVVQTDVGDDLALLKANGQFAALPLAPSRTVALGSTVATVGFPDPGLQGFSPKLAKGEIASLSGPADDARYFQISVPVQPGNSGGALVDEHGNVIGIVSAKLDAATALASSGVLPENVNYAVKSSFLLSFLESVPAVENNLRVPNTTDENFEDIVKNTQAATVMVLVY